MSELYGGAVVLFLIALWIFLADQWKRHREYKSLHRHADEVRAANARLFRLADGNRELESAFGVREAVYTERDFD